MTIKIVTGCLLDAFDNGEVDVVGHVVNCQGVMGSGIAKSIRDRYPEVYNHYRSFYENGHVPLLGCAQLNGVERKTSLGLVFNLFGQLNYGGGGKKYLNYGAISNSLKQMSEDCNHQKVGFPFKMGSDRAGGDWNIVLEMIEFYFKDHDVTIYRLEG